MRKTNRFGGFSLSDIALIFAIVVAFSATLAGMENRIKEKIADLNNRVDVLPNRSSPAVQYPDISR